MRATLVRAKTQALARSLSCVARYTGLLVRRWSPWSQQRREFTTRALTLTLFSMASCLSTTWLHASLLGG